MTRSIRKFALMLGFAAASLLVVPTLHARDAQADRPATQIDQTNVQGLKSKTVTHAVRLVAKGIRKGNKHFGEIIKRLDKDAVGPFIQHSTKIADVLDDIAKIPDLVLGVVGQKLFSILIDKEGPFRLDGGTANVIRQAVVGAINLML